jgi:hypothetical protein
LAGGGGILVDSAEDEEDDEGDHCYCGCSREGRVPDDLDVGEERRGSENLLEIAEDGDESNIGNRKGRGQQRNDGWLDIWFKPLFLLTVTMVTSSDSKGIIILFFLLRFIF